MSGAPEVREINDCRGVKSHEKEVRGLRRAAGRRGIRGHPRGQGENFKSGGPWNRRGQTGKTQGERKGPDPEEC